MNHITLTTMKLIGTMRCVAALRHAKRNRDTSALTRALGTVLHGSRHQRYFELRKKPGPVPLKLGGQMRPGALDTVWPSAT